MSPACDVQKLEGRLFSSFFELSEYQQQKRLTFSSELTSPRVSFLSPRLPSLFMTLSPLLPVSLLTVPCPVAPHPPASPCFPFPSPFLSLEEGQVQGSPITQRGLRKLYGFCPRGCHLVLSSGRLQVQSSHWLLAQPQPPSQHQAA